MKQSHWILIVYEIMEQPEQRYCIKYCEKRGDTQKETIYSRLLVKILWALQKLKNGTTTSKMLHIGREQNTFQ